MYFIATVKYAKPLEGGESGQMKVFNEKYLVDAVTVTDAEMKINKWFPSNYKDLSVGSVVFFDLDSVITTELKDDTYYLARVAYIDNSSKKPKTKTFQVLVCGDSIEEALKTIMVKFYDYTIKGIAESKIIVDSTLSQGEISESDMHIKA